MHVCLCIDVIIDFYPKKEQSFVLFALACYFIGENNVHVDC